MKERGVQLLLTNPGMVTIRKTTTCSSISTWIVGYKLTGEH